MLRMAVLGFALICSAWSQQAPAFDVASVKANHSPDARNAHVQFLPGGRLSIENIWLSAIISVAYDVPFNRSVRLSGMPDWAGSERFDIEARTDEASLPPGPADAARIKQMKAMLQTLLAERFHLKVRSETRELPVYALVIAKNGPKLKSAGIAESDCEAPGQSQIRCHELTGGMGRGLHGKAVEISDIARAIENWIDRPVIDKTGLNGLFEIDTEGWTPVVAQPPQEIAGGKDEGLDDPERHTIFLVFDRLGLKLEAQKGPVQVYTIERLEKLSEN